jgi:hypothetical protein
MIDHPAVHIIEELNVRGWTRDGLACRLAAASPDRYRDGVSIQGTPYTGISVARLSLDMYLDVGPLEPGMRLGDTAAELDRVFDVGDGFFEALERTWLSRVGR